jgi:hypothetical protein
MIWIILIVLTGGAIARQLRAERAKRRLRNCPVCGDDRYVKQVRWGFVCSSPTHEKLEFKPDSWADPDSQAAIEALEKARKQWE